MFTYFRSMSKQEFSILEQEKDLPLNWRELWFSNSQSYVRDNFHREDRVLVKFTFENDIPNMFRVSGHKEGGQPEWKMDVETFQRFFDSNIWDLEVI